MSSKTIKQAKTRTRSYFYRVSMDGMVNADMYTNKFLNIETFFFKHTPIILCTYNKKRWQYIDA